MDFIRDQPRRAEGSYRETSTAASTTRPGDRLAWIDVAKGIGIALVVIGHACAEATAINAMWARDVIYLFHMPLFFIVSGYLAKPGPLASYARQRLNALMVPYVCYLFIIGVPVALATHQLHGRSASHEFALYGFGGQHLVTYMTVFWFVTCLFFAQIIYRAMQRISASPYDWRIVGIIAACCFFSYTVLPRLHVLTALDVGVVPMALVLIWFGQIYRSLDGRPRLVFGACLIALIGLGMYLHYFPLYAFDMKSTLFGPFLPGLSTAVALSWLMFELSKRLASSKIWVACISPFGRASLTIMFLSEPVRRLLLMVGAPAVLSVAGAMIVPVVLHTLFEHNQLSSRLLLGQTVRRKSDPKTAAFGTPTR